MSTPAIPDEFLCPISYEVMEDPVLLEDGHTYDRKSIEAWLASHSTSPMTNRRLVSRALAPNYALRSAIERWRSTDAHVTAPPPEVPTTPLFSHAGAGGSLGVSAAPDAAPLPPAVIAVLDRSGSMGESAAPASQRGSEAGLFSRMDLVKHSMRTVAGLLATRSASLGIVTFSDSAETSLTLRAMDATGKGEVDRAIDALRPGGGTNIWAGLRAGLDQAAAWGAAHPGSNVHVILLTDGEPTPDYLPLQGIPTALKKKLATLKAQVTLSCFGFGYNLDTKLLEAICVEGGGTYGYIPDCTMVGTIFINYCAAALTAVAAHVAEGVGTVHAGQRKLLGTGAPTAAGICKGGAGTPLTSEEVVQARRMAQLRAALALASRSKDLHAIDAGGLRAMADDIRVAMDAGTATPFEAALLDDLDHTDDYKGQLLKAVSSVPYFQKWGLNYLVSYARAIACQQCVNFKDAALQFFAGDAFKAIQEEGNELFDTLPAPVPSLSSSGYGGGGAGYPMVSTISLSMGAFNNAGGTCWDHWSKIRMEDGGHKYMKDIVAGERVWGGHRIRAVVRTVVNARVPMVRLGGKYGGALITPWHPIRSLGADGTKGAWQFPAEVEGLHAEELPINFYYNMVLESGHTVEFVTAEGVWEACTLGHGFTDGPVITHPYFGTEAVLTDLEGARGWSEGLVLLNAAKHVRRDPETGLVCGLR